MAKPEEFIQLYLRYRIDDMIAWHTQRSALIRRRNLEFQVAIALSVLLTAVGVALAGLDNAAEGPWAVMALFFLGIVLVLTAVLLSSGFGRRGDVNDSAARALARMRDRKPGATASDLDVERWIQQTEAIISSTGSDVEPLGLADRKG